MLNPISRAIYRFINRWLFKFGYRFVEIPMVIKGIGHQIVEPCMLIKRQQLGLIPPRFKFIIFFSMDLTYSKFKLPHTNRHFLKYLNKYFVTTVFEYSNSMWDKIKFRLLAPLLYPNLFEVTEGKCYNMKYEIPYYMSMTDSSAVMFETNNLHRRALFSLIRKDRAYGEKVLEKCGVKKDDWFVTFHYRDNIFYKEVNYWEKNYNNRCVDVDSYYDACKEIIARGGWCIRIATKGANPLPAKFKSLKKVIDITEIDVDIDLLSVYLVAKCKFFLGCNSGPSLIPGFFGIPTAQAQTAPFYGAPIHHFDLFIFKKYWSQKKKGILSLKEMCTAPFSHIRLDESFKKNKIQLQNNTSEELLDLVKEMLDYCDSAKQSKGSKGPFRDVADSETYCFKACSRIGEKFFESLP